MNGVIKCILVCVGIGQHRQENSLNSLTFGYVRKKNFHLEFEDRSDKTGQNCEKY